MNFQRYLAGFLLGASCLLQAFEEEPWYDYPLEIHFRPSYLIAYYSSINGLTQPSSYQSLNQVLTANFGFTTMSQFDVQIESEILLKTKMLDPTLMSVGIQGRYLILDDVEGDPLSVSLGVNMRYVPDHVRQDPFCPYHNLMNFETHAALGKEFDHLERWTYRAFAIASIGIANQGAMWVKGLGAFAMHSKDEKHEGIFTVDSYFGFGSRHFIDLNDFHGYYNIWHQNVDLSALYRYKFDIWGALSFCLGYRPYALDYPVHETYFILKYDLPFSIF